MHYKNGRAAKAGDLVKGKGYNIKHEIVGLLIQASPSATACNCQVATVTKGSQVLHNAFAEAYKPTDPQDNRLFFAGMQPPSFHSVVATVEYGQLDAFVAIDPNTGEILPPEQINQGS